ncbi:MAG TPA: hypothetical protein VFM05_07850 [Candidatus Saccharimonadales bacterium]|nr:hypothetical protein [Candidatus Saccharimonadales bacterium]
MISDLKLPSPAEGHLPGDASIIDVITYSASLASDPRAIDQHLDSLRAITSRTAGHAALDGRDMQVLQATYNDIETYLVEHEPLRAFTRESLREQLYNHFQNKKQKKRIWRQLGAIWLCTIGFPVLPFLVPGSGASEAKVAFAMAFAFAALYIGAAWLFWSALDKFKSNLRDAYKLICLGTILLGLTLLQLPILMLIGKVDSPWLDYGGTTTTIALALLPIYLGLNRFCRLLDIKSRFLSWKLLLAVTVLAAVASVVMPHVAVPDKPEWLLDYSLVSMMAGTVLTVFSSYLVILLRRQLTDLYRKPLYWLLVLLLLFAFILLQFIVLQVGFDEDNWYTLNGMSELPLLLTAFVALKAGVAFNRASIE